VNEFVPKYISTYLCIYQKFEKKKIGSADALCTVLIVRLLRANAHAFSARTYALHWQLIWLLAAQLLSPLVLLVPFPVGNALCTMTGGGAEGVTSCFSASTGHVGILLVSAYTIASPLLTLSFVTP
jgi:hypothetical protein